MNARNAKFLRRHSTKWKVYYKAAKRLWNDVPRPERSKLRKQMKAMTPADWDKFEKDIADAFEQVP